MNKCILVAGAALVAASGANAKEFVAWPPRTAAECPESIASVPSGVIVDAVNARELQNVLRAVGEVTRLQSAIDYGDAVQGSFTDIFGVTHNYKEIFKCPSGGQYAFNVNYGAQTSSNNVGFGVCGLSEAATVSGGLSYSSTAGYGGETRGINVLLTSGNQATLVKNATTGSAYNNRNPDSIDPYNYYRVELILKGPREKVLAAAGLTTAGDSIPAPNPDEALLRIESYETEVERSSNGTPWRVPVTASGVLTVEGLEPLTFSTDDLVNTFDGVNQQVEGSVALWFGDIRNADNTIEAELQSADVRFPASENQRCFAAGFNLNN